MAGISFTSQGATPGTGFVPSSLSKGGTPQANALNNAQVNVLHSSPAPSITGQIASQTHTDAQGNSVKTTYAQPEKEQSGMLKQTPAPQAPQIKKINGMHHVPFIHTDGSVKYINAKGEISS